MAANHTHMVGAVWVERAPSRPKVEALLVKKGAPPGPCEGGCAHRDRCAQGLACAALQLFVDTGRFSAYAPRQPSRDLYMRLYPEAAAV
jgi:hypothetical protein